MNRYFYGHETARSKKKARSVTERWVNIYRFSLLSVRSMCDNAMHISLSFFISVHLKKMLFTSLLLTQAYDTIGSRLGIRVACTQTNCVKNAAVCRCNVYGSLSCHSLFSLCTWLVLMLLLLLLFFHFDMKIAFLQQGAITTHNNPIISKEWKRRASGNLGNQWRISEKLLGSFLKLKFCMIVKQQSGGVSTKFRSVSKLEHCSMNKHNLKICFYEWCINFRSFYSTRNIQFWVLFPEFVRTLFNSFLSLSLQIKEYATENLVRLSVVVCLFGYVRAWMVCLHTPIA